MPLARLREERYRACSPPTLALCARQGGARPENCGRWVPIEREARTPAGRCQGGWSDGKVDSSYRGRIGRLLLRPSYRTRTPRRVKGSYKALLTALEGVGVPPTLLAAVVGWGSSQTAVGSALGGWPSSRKVSLELAGRVRCSGLPSDWKLLRITPNRHLLGLSKGYIGVATLPPPPNGFPSSLIEASARPTVETTPQQIEGFSALGKQPYALPLPVRRDGLLRQMASLHLGYDQDSPNSARCLFSSLLVVPVR